MVTEVVSLNWIHLLAVKFHFYLWDPATITTTQSQEQQEQQFDNQPAMNDDDKPITTRPSRKQQFDNHSVTNDDDNDDDAITMMQSRRRKHHPWLIIPTVVRLEEAGGVRNFSYLNVNKKIGVASAMTTVLQKRVPEFIP